MGRILFFVLLALVAVVIYKTLKRRNVERDAGSNQLPRDNRPADIRPCRHCGAYTPVEAGVMLEGRFYCGREHAAQAGEKIS